MLKRGGGGGGDELLSSNYKEIVKRWTFSSNSKVHQFYILSTVYSKAVNCSFRML